MPNAKQILDEQFLEMRWRCLSLAADLDRLHNSAGGDQVLQSDPRLKRLREALRLLIESPANAAAGANRAEQVQMVFSDQTK